MTDPAPAETPGRLVPDIAWEPIARLVDDLEALFASCDQLLGEDVPEPRVTLDLPASDPEPFHVFALSNVRDFEVVGFLTGSVVKLAFWIDVVCVATATSIEEAARVANAYQSLLVQVPLCDPLLGGTVEEVGAPQVADYRTWADADGRRHAGYRLGFNVSKYVQACDACRQILEGMENG